eukprot:Hpha_TRINITY_DN15281_c0_g1::TRINITY_DN15281_c0_g1_i2::g.67311::m.67311
MIAFTVALLLGTQAAQQCTTETKAATDLPGNDLAQHPSTTLVECSILCCETTGCEAFTYLSSGAPAWGDCTEGLSCCYLKTTDKGTVSATNRHTFGDVTRSTPPPDATMQWSGELDLSDDLE